MEDDMTTILDELTSCVGGLTVKDPHAQAIVHGPKRIENRTKRPPEKVMGERIAVHCGKSVDGEAMERVRERKAEEEPEQEELL